MIDFTKFKHWKIPEGNSVKIEVGGVVIWQAKTQAEQLTAPTISLDGDILTMTATDSRTEEFVIFVDGVETATVEAPKEETYTVSGTWKFNEIPTTCKYGCSVKFISNGVSWYGITGINDGSTDLGYKNSEGVGGIGLFDIVYVSPINDPENYGWTNQAYRTITFDGVQTVSKEFYEWFVANATRQTITFTIDGTSYTALSGMTWGEWVESEYNTDNYFVENDRIKIGVTAVYLTGVGFMGPAANIRGNTEYTLRTGGAGN